MNPFHLLSAAVSLAHAALLAVVPVLDPMLGPASVAAGIVLLTLLVRAALVPLSIRIVRADRARLALAPTLDRLRRRHSRDPARLVRELQAAHQEAGISQFAGLGPALAQAPFLMVIYRLCTTVVIAGTPNLVLGANLLGAPLAQGGLAILSSAGLFSGPSLVVLAMLLLMGSVAAWSSSVALARLRATAAAIAKAAGRTAVPIAGPPAAQVWMARVLPFGTVAAALIVPLAVSVYLLTSTTWAVAERVVLPRMI